MGSPDVFAFIDGKFRADSIPRAGVPICDDSRDGLPTGHVAGVTFTATLLREYRWSSTGIYRKGEEAGLAQL